jgi:hypothetical protein
MILARLRTIPAPVWLLLFLAILAVLHIRHAAAVHLNPDEALHYNLANQSNVIEAYRAGKTSAHPPLFFLALRFWRKLGHSEWFLRLLPIAGYLGMLWFAYGWIRRAFDPFTAAAAVLLLALAAPLFRLATEVRNYMFALCFIMAALDRFEAFRKSRALTDLHLAFAACLAAVFTNYFCFWFAAAFVLYGFLRLREDGAPKLAWRSWLAGCAVLALAGAGLYRTHLRYMRASSLADQARDSFLKHVYCGGDCRPIDFVLDNTTALYTYIFGSSVPALIAALLVLFGLVRMARSSVALLALFTIPWLAALTPALLGLYPYGGTRHSLVPAVFAVCCAAVGAGAVLRHRPWPFSLGAAALALWWSISALPEPQVLPAAVQQRATMQRAVGDLLSTVPQGGVVFTDIEGLQLLSYYVAPDRVYSPKRVDHFFTVDLGSIRLIVAPTWVVREDLDTEWRLLAASDLVAPGTTVWVFQAGWDPPLLPGQSDVQRFGPYIAFFPKTTT